MDPYLFSVVKKEELKDMLETFYKCTKIPIQLLDEKGNQLESYGENVAFCELFRKGLPKYDDCTVQHSNASKKAMSLGEPYIFSCRANLNHIVFPLINKEALLGAVLVGPFILDEFNSIVMDDISNRYPFTTSELFEMYDEAKKIETVTPEHTRYISKLLYYMFSNIIQDSKQALILKQDKFHQQAIINESIQMYKTAGLTKTDSYPYEKECILITKLKTGAVDEAKAILNDLLGYVLFSEGSNLSNVKSRSIELCALLSRAAIAGGAISDRILKIDNNFLSKIVKIDNLDDLCYQLQNTVDVFTDCMFERVPSKNNEIIKKAIYFISNNFSKNISLEQVANEVHLNSAYFSTIFKQSTGSSFKEYLNIVRIEESKRLLSNTDYPLLDIAIASGFEDQSYFSKVFKKFTGFTPKQYRDS